ncbi:uncharacterized protein PAC_00147 [Phialocephala subalpina]|uniref:Uncharacterized protein n=1 Tax=Phialocephala subalpina TaxID=576137 RepID=A0A1L7WBW4_9HELO|nr:uncharacterized protein PAC_00147 [Phialocephala subalpina]
MQATTHKTIQFRLSSFETKAINRKCIAPRMFDAIDNFPITSPIVSFTGPIIGSGLTLLRDDPLSGLSETQRKCCGGFHQFQVFIIFSIHINPWTLLCKKMVERQDTQFQPNTAFTCTGKVAGFLGHHAMVQPPQLRQEYVFTVVPDTWTFLDKMSRGFTSASLLTAEQASSMATPKTLPTNQISHNSSRTPNASGTEDTAEEFPSPTSKRPRTDYTPHIAAYNTTSTIASDKRSHTPPGTPTRTSNPFHTDQGMKLPSFQPATSPTTNLIGDPVSRLPTLPDDTKRTQRNRHPAPKVLHLD